jgi:hypothetical protein
MKLAYLTLLAGVLLSSCSGGDSNAVTYDTETDTSMRSIDSSAIINDTTRLPQDSTATGVQH